MSLRIPRPVPWLSFALVSLSLAACSSSDGSNSDGTGGTGSIEEELDQNPPLSDPDALFLDAPTNDKLPELGKADAVYPAKLDLVATQSSVKSQGRRGVCSIFSTVGLMEHLYIKEGTITDPDFSEQHLQYSVKFDVGSFPKTSGSNARSNLDAINRFGIAEEAAWPYEPSQWDEDDDPACTGDDDQPTRCYTDGEPPESMASAERWYLPRGRWISSRPRSIKAHLTSTQTAAIVGLTFFYQAWNHGGSKLKTNKDYYKAGYVTTPSEADKEDSLQRRAGHSILIVGWDDDLTVQKRDSEGNLLEDENGEPLVDKGFFVIKNSWGTGSYGKTNPFGPGYGYISYDYVQEHGSVYASGVPTVELPAESCSDGVDNDRNGDTDCDDAACAGDDACTSSEGGTFVGMGGNIPDNDPAGFSDSVTVDTTGSISAVKLNLDISHTYKGDLVVKLVRDDGAEVVLHDRDGGSADDLVESYSISDFNGQEAAGTWTLVVSDNANIDTGSVNSWSLEVVTGDPGSGGPSEFENTTSQSIPDDDAAGVSSDIEVTGGGTISGLTVGVDITHPYKGDLTLRLQKIGLGEVVLQQADAADGPFSPKSFNVSDFNGESADGTWRLVVVDEAGGDVGTLNSWSLSVSN